MTIGSPPAQDPGIFTSLVDEDGKLQKVRVLEGQLFVCKGCCCGNVERGKPAVPLTEFKDEWKARGLRTRVHLTVSGCLGPCVGLNVVLFVYGGQTLWLQSVNSASDVALLCDYIETVVDHSRFELPTGPLAEKIFQRYASDAICSIGQSPPPVMASTGAYPTAPNWLSGQ